MHYLRVDGGNPFLEWFGSLGESNPMVGRITNRMVKVELGNLGHCKSVREGVNEFIFDETGPGYRVYYGEDGDQVILLLGGTKKTQTKDISRAKDYWSDYKARRNQNA